MDITVYSMPHCNQCKMLKRKLDEREINFLDVEDENKVVELGQQYNIMSAPVVEIDGEFFNMQQAGRKLGL